MSRPHVTYHPSSYASQLKNYHSWFVPVIHMSGRYFIICRWRASLTRPAQTLGGSESNLLLQSILTQFILKVKFYHSLAPWLWHVNLLAFIVFKSSIVELNVIAWGSLGFYQDLLIIWFHIAQPGSKRKQSYIRPGRDLSTGPRLSVPRDWASEVAITG